MKRLDLRKTKEDKKAQGISVTMLVIIVLALIVLAVLAFGFGMGWQNMWQSVTAFFGSSNVGAVAQACNTACMTQSHYDFCQRERTVRADDEIFNGDSEIDATCDRLATEYPEETGVKPCDAIDCGEPEAPQENGKIDCWKIDGGECVSEEIEGDTCTEDFYDTKEKCEDDLEE